MSDIQADATRGSGDLTEVGDDPLLWGGSKVSVSSASMEMYMCAQQEDEEVTGWVESVATAIGGHLAGREHRIKTQESVTRKIQKLVDAARFRELRAEQRTSAAPPRKITETELSDEIVTIAWSTTDVLRYTIIIPIAKYTEGVAAARVRLIGECDRRRGTETAEDVDKAELKNYWQRGDNYRGINDAYYLPTSELFGRRQMCFEVQYHTEESFAAKKEGHKLYEEMRLSRDPKTKVSMFERLRELSDAVAEPKGVMELPELRQMPQPKQEVELYAEAALSRVLRQRDLIYAAMQRVLDDMPRFARRRDGDGQPWKPQLEWRTMTTAEEVEKGLVRLMTGGSGHGEAAHAAAAGRRRGGNVALQRSMMMNAAEAVMHLDTIYVISLVLPDATYKEDAIAIAAALREAAASRLAQNKELKRQGAELPEGIDISGGPSGSFKGRNGWIAGGPPIGEEVKAGSSAGAAPGLWLRLEWDLGSAADEKSAAATEMKDSKFFYKLLAKRVPFVLCLHSAASKAAVDAADEKGEAIHAEREEYRRLREGGKVPPNASRIDLDTIGLVQRRRSLCAMLCGGE